MPAGTGGRSCADGAESSQSDVVDLTTVAYPPGTRPQTGGASSGKLHNGPSRQNGGVRSRRWGLPTVTVALLLVLQAAVAALDLGFDAGTLTVVYAVPVLLMALVAPPRTVALFALASIGLALESGEAHDSFLKGGHVLRLALVGAAAGIAVTAAAARQRLERDVERLGLLAAVGDVAAGGHGFAVAAGRVLDILIPALADGGRISMVTTDGGPRIAAERGLATAPAQRTIAIPLRLADQVLGTMTLLRRGVRARFRAGELQLLGVLAGRVALALENARLLDDLSRAERELAGILSALAEAITVQDREGGIVYANEAAARLLGAASVEEVVSADPDRMRLRFETFHADGTPVEVGDLPGRRIMAGDLSPPPLLTHSFAVDGSLERWSIVKATPIFDDSGVPVLAVNIVEDVTEQQHAQQRAHVLAQAADVLARGLAPEETTQRFVEALVPDLADWGAVDLPGPVAAVLAAVAHEDPDKLALARELRERHPVSLVDDAPGLAAVLRGGPTYVHPEIVTDEELLAAAVDERHLDMLRGIGFGHIAILPMRAGGETVGALTLVRAPTRPPFSEMEIQLAEELARRAATSVLNGRLTQARAEIAETLQRSLLPRALPQVAGLRFASHYAAAGVASDVGGDFYDAIPVGDGLLLVIGDVTGKGASAAALTALARAVIESVATYTGSATAALAHLNALLLRRAELSLVSVACVHVRPDDGILRAEVLCAGHPPPLLLRSGEVRTIGLPGALPGAFADAGWPPIGIDLEDGDVIVLHTDGVTDMVGAGGERLGEDRLHLALVGSSEGDADGAVARVRQTLTDFGEGEQRDDTAVVAVAVDSARAFTERGFVRSGAGHETTPDALLHAMTVTDGSVTGAAHERHFGLDGSPQSIAVARRIVDRELGPRLAAEALHDVRLLVSELASNAVKHGGGGPYELLVRIDEHELRVEVVDRGGGFATAASDRLAGLEEGGYGLGLVERLSSRWGVERDSGTRVWFELAAPGEPPA